MSPSPCPWLDALLVASLALPVALIAAWPVPALRRASVALSPWAATPALLLALMCAALPESAPALTAPQLFTGLGFAVDPVGAPMLLTASLLWVAGGAFARRYHADDPGRERFFAFFTMTMAGNLGVILAADLLTFYLFFAVMTFSAWGLIVHRNDPAAMRAGRVTIILALVGEVAILAGLFGLGAASTGELGFGRGLDGAWGTLDRDGDASWLTALLVAGFAVKAGLVPLHVWLPLAHPAAPTAASALLSGAMIKVGLLGWLRVAPSGVALPELGAILVGAGLLTALHGVLVGLAQDDPKVVLAYSSVSQMGTLAIGAGLLLSAGTPESPALAAVLVYAAHHGVAKGALFLAVGVAHHLPGSSEPARRRRWRLGLALGVALPALALAGAPLTSGAWAKGLLKGALEDAPDALGAADTIWPEVLSAALLVAAAGTTALMIRFWVTLERQVTTRGPGHPTDARATSTEGPWGLALPWGVLALASAAAPLWLPWAVPSAGALSLNIADLLSALLPLLVGLGAAWAVVYRPQLIGPLARWRVPPADLLVSLLALARRLLALARRLPRPRAPRPPPRLDAAQRGLASARTRALSLLLGGPARELALLRGPILGLVLVALAVALTLALAMG